MTTDDIHILYEYDRWANHRALQQVSSLTPEQFIRDLRGSFPSVRHTLLHILGGEWIWLQYWKLPRPNIAVLSDLRTQRDAIFNPEAFPNPHALRPKWMEVEAEMSDFVLALTPEALDRVLPVRGTQLKLAHILQHVANHSTSHRGQLALMLRQLGAEPLPTDFHVFLVAGPGPASSDQSQSDQIGRATTPSES